MFNSQRVTPLTLTSGPSQKNAMFNGKIQVGFLPNSIYWGSSYLEIKLRDVTNRIPALSRRSYKQEQKSDFINKNCVQIIKKLDYNLDLAKPILYIYV